VAGVFATDFFWGGEKKRHRPASPVFAADRGREKGRRRGRRGIALECALLFPSFNRGEKGEKKGTAVVSCARAWNDGGRREGEGA